MSPSLVWFRQFVLFALAALAFEAHALDPLPALKLVLNETSISGISSGGYMAVQFQVAHSSIIKGAGVVAGGPWNCSQGDVMTATTKCSCTLNPTSLTCKVTEKSAKVATLVSQTHSAANKQWIDDPLNLAQQRVLSFAGGKDQTVPGAIVTQLGTYYRKLGVPDANLKEVRNANAGHTMPTPAYGIDCPITGEPYIGKCNEDMAGEILQHIYGALTAPVAGPAKGHFVEFDQRPYIPKDVTPWKAGIDNSGWLYVPDACAQAGQNCRVHIALHGCRQGQSYLPLTPIPGGGLYYGTTFVKNTGYDHWADANRLVILFPQAVSNADNPNGCWDWWGFTGKHYADKQGVQIRFLRAMVDRLSAAP